MNMTLFDTGPLTDAEDNSAEVMEKLYPALVKCFAVILCGYTAGRMNIISGTEAKGLNTFVGTFALPALIFSSLAKLNLHSVNWPFLASILLAKALVFFSVAILTVLVARPLNLGRAGLFAIFCTQSNDFAIGNPIVTALYESTHPEYQSYLYLMAPISLIILNPVGFTLMEIHKRRAIPIDDGIELIPNTKSNQLTAAVAVAKGIALNPVVMMTALGIIGNFVFDHHIPIFLSGILEVLGDAFSATALFLLGLRMVGKVKTLQGPALVLPAVLIIVKLLVLPIITREVVSLLHVGHNASDTRDLSTYGFLYGTFPAAPGVFVFATQYALDVDLIASSMVACTFLSAPLMFVSAKMIILAKMDPNDYLDQLGVYVFDISIIALIASVWVLALFVLTKKYKRLPHRITCCLVISQCLSCIGVILWYSLNRNSPWSAYIQFVVTSIGVYSGRLWTAFLAATLLLMQCRSLCFVLKLQAPFIIAGWGIPVILTALLLIFDRNNVLNPEKRDPNNQFGSAQTAVAVFLLIACLIVTVGCLVFHQRYGKRRARYLSLSSEISDSGCCIPNNGSISNNDETNINSNLGCGGCNGAGDQSLCCSAISPAVDIEDLGSGNSPIRYPPINSEAIDICPLDTIPICPSLVGCSGASNEECRDALPKYSDHIAEGLEPIEVEESIGDQQVLRHLVLLIMLLCSMFVGISISIWTLIMEEKNGIYVELSFLDTTLNFGQGLIIFAVFGLDIKEVVLPVLKLWRNMCYGANVLTLPSLENLSFETKHICEQFNTHHRDNCRNAIAKDTRWRIKIYSKVFKGSEFIDWLIQIGLARDRVEAIIYGRHLLDGRVIRHISNVHHFYDRPLLYTFIENE